MPDIAVWIKGPDAGSEPEEGFGKSRGPRGHRGPGPHRRYGRRGRRARRGDARLAILLLLAEEPRNGYGLMQEIEERSGGVWRPSPGSVYPALSQLEDEGLIETTGEGRKAFTLSEEGRNYVEANRELIGEPWKTVTEGASGELSGLRESGQALAMAATQVARTGNAEQIKAAKDVMDQARRGLYRLLAGEGPGAGEA
jgi:DNA-binding PadR family transcriptional regulator